MEEKFIRRLISTLKCALCGQRHTSANIRVLGHREDLWFWGVFCPSCGSQSLVAAIIKEGRAIEMVTDLTKAEYARFADSEPVGADDVIEVHNFLKDFGGDFSTLFSTQK